MDLNLNIPYVIKLESGELYRFYYETKVGVVYQIFNGGEWSENIVAYKTEKEYFYVYLSPDNKIHLFCQDALNSIVLCIYQQDKWSEQVIFSSRASSLNNVDIVYFYVLFYVNDLHLFYVLQDRKSKNKVLVHQISLDKNHWMTPKIVDSIEGSKGKAFDVQVDNKDNILLFYKNRREKHVFGYRRYSKSNGIWSDYFIIENSSLPFDDYSILQYNGDIHALYIKKDNFYSRLFYRCKSSSWKKSITLFENSGIKYCSMFLLDNHLWIIWICENKLYSCYSTNNGEHFSIPSVHKEVNMDHLIKSSFKSNFSKDIAHLTTKEVLMDNINKAQFLVISELFPTISGYDIPLETEAKLENPKENILSMDSNLNFIRKQMDEVYEKIYICKKSLNEKEQQISQLNFTLQLKNNDIAKLDYNLNELKKEKEELAMENKILKEKVTMSEEKLIPKEFQIKTLEDRCHSQQTEITKLQSEISSLKKELESLKITYSHITEISKKNKSSLFNKLFGDNDY